MIDRGQAHPLGASVTPRGVNFAVFSAHASAIEVCVFDESGEQELQRFVLPGRTGDIWHGELAGAGVGLVYALRADGPWQPEAGHRFDATKWLLDPCAREILERDPRKARVVGDVYDWGGDTKPQHQREDLVIYELHVKGFSVLNPHVPKELRGSYAGLAHPASLDHLRSLGVTAVSLLPVHQHLDEPALINRGLVNYWGYNTLGFFCADWRYASEASRAAVDPGRALRDEFRDMVKALHAAGIEVILDVVFNHTCESDEHGPTLSWRGLDNASWYRLESPAPLRYANDTGCGNMLDLRQPRVLQFVMDSLRFWAGEMHIDGFRFDLAPVLARGDHGFDAKGPFFQVIAQDPVLAHVRLVAEPWDVGHGGYQLGAFPRGWLEWNDRFRDTARRWWVTGEATRGEWAQRLCGSADTLQHRDRDPADSVNYVVSHDGFTLRDLVSYESRHNENNGEQNRDGHATNHSRNYGIEGDTDEPLIRERRQRVQRALLASVLLSQGTPMLAAGSELGHTQRGNNNAYCQDGPLSWLDWAAADAELLRFVQRLARLRERYRPFANSWYVGDHQGDGGYDIGWFGREGEALEAHHWHHPQSRVLGVHVQRTGGNRPQLRVYLLFNAEDEVAHAVLPSGTWRAVLDTSRSDGAPASAEAESPPAGQRLRIAVGAESMLMLVQGEEP
ncbi:MAG: glycogen debranching protein GlgX [Sinobacteraceae bacterium]|nr:glycogen debranching protein GlgX [Nevskiaceae bacterium]